MICQNLLMHFYMKNFLDGKEDGIHFQERPEFFITTTLKTCDYDM